jgi:hypothetical protein
LVRLVESKELTAMHRAMLAEHAGLLALASSRYVGDNYRPHVTLQGQNDPESGPITIEKISLVQGTGQKPAKQIIKHFDPSNQP